MLVALDLRALRADGLAAVHPVGGLQCLAKPRDLIGREDVGNVQQHRALPAVDAQDRASTAHWQARVGQNRTSAVSSTERGAPGV